MAISDFLFVLFWSLNNNFFWKTMTKNQTFSEWKAYHLLNNLIVK